MRAIRYVLMALAVGVLSFTTSHGQASDCPGGVCDDSYYCGYKQLSRFVCDNTPQHVGCCGTQGECHTASSSDFQWEIADPPPLKQANCYRKTSTYCRTYSPCRVPEGGGVIVYCPGDPPWQCELYGTPWTGGTRVDFALDCEDCWPVRTCYYCGEDDDCPGSMRCNKDNCCE